ncbi:MAG: hypothetical protein COA97_00440 [Flavobacteriales bacterium]|nr:MAG: hypothetical protein COA97_00440 [Flavobacteriales bacterium]
MLLKSASILLLSFFLLGINTSFSQCEKLKKKKLYQLLGAAECDNYRSTDIKTHENTLKYEYQINLFKGVVYKLIFDVSDMPEGVIIRLYDLGKKRGAGKFEEVFNSETAKKMENDTYEITMEFPQRKMMVSYNIINNTKPGCVAFILGYYFKNRIR